MLAALTKLNLATSVKLIVKEVCFDDARSKKLRIHLGLLFYLRGLSSRSANQADEIQAQVYSGRV